MYLSDPGNVRSAKGKKKTQTRQGRRQVKGMEVVNRHWRLVFWYCCSVLISISNVLIICEKRSVYRCHLPRAIKYITVLLRSTVKDYSAVSISSLQDKLSCPQLQ